MNWLDKMDKIMDRDDILVNREDAQAVIRGLSLEIKKADTKVERVQDTANDNFNMYARQCEITEHWIKKYQVIENMVFLDKVKFLFGKSLHK